MRDLSFYGSVAVTAVLAVIAFKLLAATRAGDVVPGLRRAAGVI